MYLSWNTTNSSTALNPGDGMSFELSVTPNVENEIHFEISSLDLSKNASIQILETNGSEQTVLTAVPIKDAEGLVIPFTPHSGKVKFVLLGPIKVWVRRICAWHMDWVEEDQLVTICDGDKDKYRFGFNGQEKVNEWSGVGNHLDFKFRGYDSRTGRFNSVDPLFKDYPWNSSYAFAENDVIRSIDLEGLEKIYYQTAQAQKYLGLRNAIKVLTKSGIMQDLQKQFSFGNNKTDIHIIVEELPDWQAGGTSVFILSNPSLAAKQILLQDMRNSALPTANLNPIIQTTLKKNRSPIIVRLNKADVIKAAKGGKLLSKLAFTITHEIKAHALNEKDGESTKGETEEHQIYYNDKSLKGSESVPYDKIKKDSPAGRDKQKIEDAVKHTN